MGTERIRNHGLVQSPWKIYPLHAPAPTTGEEMKIINKLKGLFVRDQEKEKFLFLTHTPGDWCKPGTVQEVEGHKFVVTRWERQIPTALICGGSAPCYEIRGKKEVKQWRKGRCGKHETHTRTHSESNCQMTLDGSICLFTLPP